MISGLAIIGTRPQLIKHAVLERAMSNEFHLLSLHTGQHYNREMDQIFFEELNIKKPEYHLAIGSDSPTTQVARMMMGIEDVCNQIKPNFILVYGDTNSTLSGSLAAAKMNIPLIHIEAGMRSWNMEMPEEVNRILTDRLSRLLFTTTASATKNLEKENVAGDTFEVGDIMKDLLMQSINEGYISPLKEHPPFYYASIHRPYNTDEKFRLIKIFEAMQNLDCPVIFSCHPRTSNQIEAFEIKKQSFRNIQFIPPQGYYKNLSYVLTSKALITDSGGMQKEAYWLQKKCVTIRKETEWIETLHSGANVLLFDDLSSLQSELTKPASWNASLYGDGAATIKILQHISKYFFKI